MLEEKKKILNMRIKNLQVMVRKLTQLKDKFAERYRNEKRKRSNLQIKKQEFQEKLEKNYLQKEKFKQQSKHSIYKLKKKKKLFSKSIRVSNIKKRKLRMKLRQKILLKRKITSNNSTLE